MATELQARREVSEDDMLHRETCGSRRACADDRNRKEVRYTIDREGCRPLAWHRRRDLGDTGVERGREVGQKLCVSWRGGRGGVA